MKNWRGRVASDLHRAHFGIYNGFYSLSSSSKLGLVRGEDNTLGLVRGDERRFAKYSQANLDNNTLLSRIVSLGHLHIAQAPKSSFSSSVRS